MKITSIKQFSGYFKAFYSNGSALIISEAEALKLSWQYNITVEFQENWND